MSESVTPEELERARKRWAKLQSHQCEAVLVLATGWRRFNGETPHIAAFLQSAALLSWEQLGYELQKDIARAVPDFLTACVVK